MMSSKIINAEWFNSSYKYTLRDLQDHIISTKIAPEPNYIKVFTFEASAGKTQTVCEALKKLYEIDPTVKTLIVTKLIDEQWKLQENLGNIAKVINSEINENTKEQELEKYTVLIITHELYTRLCRNEKRRQYYTKGRDLLIIDEQLDILDILEFSFAKSDEIMSKLKEVMYYEKGKQVDLCELFGQIIHKINKTMNDNPQKKMRFVSIEDENIEQKIEDLKKILYKAKFPEDIKPQDLIYDIDTLKKFFNNEYVIACNGRLYTYNPDIEYFLLKNNIMLDASGKFLELYKLSDRFKMFDSERIIQHSNTTLTFITENSTTSAIKRDEDKYYTALIEYIKKHTTKSDKVLIIGRKDDEEYVKPILKDNVQFVNFNAMRGRNDWSDFNKCFVIHLPNDNFYKYVFQYLYYINQDLKQSDLEIQKIDTNAGFKNNIVLEKLHITDVVSDIYQGLKRVNRVNTEENECELYVVCNNKWIQDLLIEQFAGLKQVKYEKLFERTNTLTYERMLNLEELFKSMKQGEKIKKEEIRKILNISSRKEFNKIIKCLGGQEFLQKLGIKEERYYFIKTA